MLNNDVGDKVLTGRTGLSFGGFGWLVLGGLLVVLFWGFLFVLSF